MTRFTTRPVIMGRRGVVTSGHYLATAAGFRIMEQGGNAVDAAASMCFCLNLLEPHQCGLGGEVPTLVYAAAEGKTYAISGVGWTPEAFTIEWCSENGIDLIPGDGYLPACVPAPVGTWTLAVARFGTMTMAQILQPVIELAEGGYPVYRVLHEHLTANRELYLTRYPSTGAVYCPEGRVPEVGEVIRNPDFAAVMRALCDAEAQESSGRRIAGIEAACERFYRGDIAGRMVQFMADNPVLDASGREHVGLLTEDDIAQWHATIEVPVSYNYRGLDVHKCPTWTQGPVFLQQLAILEGYDLAGMGHNSAEYLHSWIECAKLAFADREAYYGDPACDEVPFDVLLSPEYSQRRRELISPEASRELRPGDVGEGLPDYLTFDVRQDNRRALGWDASLADRQESGSPHVGDTTQLDSVDRFGNMVAATPSGGWIGSSPVVRGLGFPMGTRGQMFYLDGRRPNSLAGRKRPRATLTPTVVTRDGAPYMAFGTPGGDSQDQWTLQFFLNHVDFGLDLQGALDAPTVYSLHFPSSFYPREAHPARVAVEDRVPEEVVDELRRRGHEVVLDEGWVHGKVMGIVFDRERGVIRGGCSAKGNIGYAIGW